MEVIEKKSSYTWSKQAMELIDQLVDLNEAQIKDKSLIFDRFYEMWENDGLVVTISRAKDQLNQQRNYIKNCIFFNSSRSRARKNERSRGNLQLYQIWATI